MIITVYEIIGDNLDLDTLPSQLEVKDKEIHRLEEGLNWLRGVYSVAVTKLQETTKQKKSVWSCAQGSQLILNYL